jgi:hypothetical protein
MQVIGLAPAFVAIDVIAARSTRQPVTEWADRVVRRHVRRTPDLHRRLMTEKAVVAAISLDRLSAEVSQKIVVAFRAGEEICTPDKDRVRAFIERALDTMDFMESLPLSDRRIRRIERLSWADAEQMSVDWHASLARVRSKSKDVMAGVRKIAEFGDGSFVAELTTAQALKTEGAEMGHCVGGYWSRVESGDTRIVSLRDPDGHPHVTIELTRPSEYHVEGRGPVRLMAKLQAGRNQVVASGEWYAAQIRGKQNRMPVAKYADKVVQWMQDASIPTREEGFQVKSGKDALVIYAVPRGQGFFLCENAEEALAAVSDQAIAQLSSPGARQGLLKVISRIEDFARSCFNNKSDFDALVGLRGSLLSADETESVETRDHAIVAVPGGSSLRARIHTIPTVGLALINSGRADGAEDRVLNGLEPKLREVIAAMKAEQGVYHVVRSSVQGLKKNDLVKAFFACGLGQDYAVAAAQLPTIVRMAVKSTLLDAKRARLAGVNTNIVTNMLSDGFEARISNLLCTQFGSECIVIGPEAHKPAATLRASSSPVVKSYPMPRR